MTNTKHVTTHLREAAEQFLLTADILEGNEGTGISTQKPHLVGGGGGGGGKQIRQMTPAGRRRIAEAQTKRWANQRKTA